MHLQGKTAIVTGAGRRLGAAIAEALAGRGCNLLIHHHASAQPAAAFAQRAAALGVHVHVAQADLAELGGIRQLFQAFDDYFPRLDVLVNSAAILRAVDLLAATEADWQATMDLNLRGAFFCLQQAALRMQAHGGAIINLSDAVGHRPHPRFPIHSISKAGVETLTRVAALRLAPGVRVNAVAPGPVLQPDSMSDARWRQIGAALPLGRPGTPESVVQAVLFLAENDFITGETLVVDGGDALL
jgi:NAD(P)-dependent dehydrogenase (short-subunit alcohol dehydrogenase family)